MSNSGESDETKYSKYDLPDEAIRKQKETSNRKMAEIEKRNEEALEIREGTTIGYAEPVMSSPVRMDSFSRTVMSQTLVQKKETPLRGKTSSEGKEGTKNSKEGNKREEEDTDSSNDTDDEEWIWISVNNIWKNTERN